LRWYKDEDHIGYDLEGQKLLRKARGDKLDALLARNDSSKALRTVYDEYNDEEITLTKEELNMVLRIRKGQFPHVAVNPYEPYVDWFTRDQEVTPLINAPEPKRRFIPSKWEEKK
jgi:ribosome biogenesis protein ERB1